VVFLILDAVGYRQLRDFLDTEDSLLTHLSDEGRLVPITSVFPSTTVSALTSIWTGQPPLGHGFLGTKLLLPDQGVLANMLKMAPAAYGRGGRLVDWGWDPERFVTAPSLGKQLRAAGVETVAHTRFSFLGSSLTQIFLRGMAEVRGYVGLSDLWLNLQRTLAERDADQRLFVDVYWGGIDNVGHVYGPTGAHLPWALRHLARSLEEDFLSRLTKDAREGTLLVITADHGQIATPSERVVRLPDHPQLKETLLLPPAGESRAAYLYVRPGQKDILRTYVKAHLSDHFALLDTERALELGLFGSVEELTPHLRARLGDVLLIAKDESRLTTKEKKENAAELRGHHGSLTPEEMLVPLLLVRLDRLQE
jgi:predicted AlkP superfamily pyrophosphatase or phosphodiesterase